MQQTHVHSQDATLEHVLERNLDATDRIKATANELDVVHAVLESTIPETAMQGDLKAAVERTDELEQRLTETAQSLEQTNALLAREIEKNSA